MSVDRLRDWITRHIPALVFTAVVGLTGVVYFIPPPAESFRQWQTLIDWLFVVNGFTVALRIVTEPLQSVPIVYYAVFVLLVLIVGLVLEWLWRRAWWGKLLVAAGVVLHGGVFGFLVSFGSGFTTQYPPNECRHFFSPTNGMRVIAYPSAYWDAPIASDLFILTTRDGGQTWNQRAYNSYSDEFPSCEKMTGQLSESFYWLWKDDYVAVTPDGGQTWHALRLGRNIDIYAVTFEDTQHGRLEMDRWPGPEEVVLSTEDGGVTWR